MKKIQKNFTTAKTIRNPPSFQLSKAGALPAKPRPAFNSCQYPASDAVAL
jgi:hypothetical protein